jgi:hypothetical protein
MNKVKVAIKIKSVWILFTWENNTTSTFSRTMADIFKEWTTQFLNVFVNDVNIHSRTWSEHLCHIRLVLQKLTKVNLKLNLSKCCFGSKSITFLGHIVDYVESQPNPKKIATIYNFPTPNIATNFRAFLGLTGYYRRFIVGSEDYKTIVCHNQKRV